MAVARRFAARTRWLLPLVAAAAVAAMVSASVFVVYPVSGTLSFVSPPIVLNAGSNAGQADLGGNTISVQIGDNQTSATITLHPTYETTYYYSILYVNNTDTVNSYYVKFKLSTSSTLSNGEQVTALIYDSNGNLIDTVTIDSTTTSSWNTNGWLTLGAGSGFRIDFKIVYPEGQPLPGTQSFTLSIVYSNQNAENPPAAATS